MSVASSRLKEPPRVVGRLLLEAYGGPEATAGTLRYRPPAPPARLLRPRLLACHARPLLGADAVHLLAGSLLHPLRVHQLQSLLPLELYLLVGYHSVDGSRRAGVHRSSCSGGGGGDGGGMVLRAAVAVAGAERLAAFPVAAAAGEAASRLSRCFLLAKPAVDALSASGLRPGGGA